MDSLAGRSVLVTGGAGFIGSHLVDALLEGGARVQVLDNFSTADRSNLARSLDHIEFIEGDLRDSETCVRACRGVSLVFHQAALGSVPRSLVDPATTIAVNTTGTAHLFAAARLAGVDRVVYASSSSVYGDSSELPKREGREGRPLSPYAWSKVMVEEIAGAFHSAYGVESIGLRYFNVYGPRQSADGPYAAVVPRFFEALLRGKRPLIYGDGSQSRDFTAVADAVSANLAAAVAETGVGGAFNIGGGRRVTINELARATARAVGTGLEPRYDPPRAGDVLHSLADLENSRSKLGYRPTVDLERGLEACSAYYRSNLV